MKTILPRVLKSLVLFGLCAGVIGSPTHLLGQDFNFGLDPLIKLPGLDGAEKPAGKLVEVALDPVKGTAADLKPGDQVTLAITVNVPANSYTYSQTTPAGSKTKFTIGKMTGLEAVGEKFQPARKPKKVSIKDFGDVEKFEKSITWTRKYRLTKDTQPADVTVEGKVRSQICDESTCRFATETFAVALVKQNASNAIVKKERPKVQSKPGPAEITIKLSPSTAAPGETVTLSIQLALDEGWHTYSLTQKPDNAAVTTAIKISESKNLKPQGEGFTADKKFEDKIIELPTDTYEQEVYHGTVTWTRQYEVQSAASDDGFGLVGQIKYQVCDKNRCLRPQTVSFDFPSNATQVAQEPAPPETAPTLESDSATELSSREERLKELLGEPVAETEVASDSNENDKAPAEGFWLFVATAVVAGFAALLTPCVYPMVPITISFFTKQAEKEHHRPTTLALVYCFGIMATFTILGLLISVFFQATALNQLANNIWLNLMLTAVIAFFGISMLGVFEISVPSWLLTWSAGKESKGGIVGTLFMALTFTLVSFTCTFAFAGGLLVMASKGEFFWPIVGMLAFSGAFAFPFFLLAMFPKMLAKMPKSGGWMNIMKITMGFVEIGAALKFLSVADAVYFGQPTYLTYNVVMGLWFVLAVLAGLYPLGLFRMPHDTPGKFTAGRFAFAVPFLALAAMLGAGLFTSMQPSGWVWDNIAAFAPPKFEGNTQGNPEETETAQAEIGPYLEHDDLTYALDFFQALDYAKKTNQPLFLDITGQNCLNCRLMEKSVFPKTQNRVLLKKFVRAQLFVDQIPLIKDEQERKELIQINQQIQRATDDVSLPGYVVLNPHDVGKNGKLLMLSFFKGMEKNDGEFTNFLNQGLEEWQKQSGEPAVQSASTNRMNQAVTQN